MLSFISRLAVCARAAVRGRRTGRASQVDGDKLVLTAYPPVSATTPETAPVKIESLSRRESAPR